MDSVRVLIAEDDYLIGEMIRGMLEENGHAVAGEATNGFEAIEQTRALRPDVVLMDIKMPDMSGIKAAERIIAECPAPIVILTAYETPDLVEQASEAGVGAYLVKPPNAREIERAIAIARARFKDIMALRRLNAELTQQNEALDAFAYMVAHDLKSQLAPLIGFTEILEFNYMRFLNEDGQKCIHKVSEICQKMANIIDELLLLAALRSEDVPSEPLDMAAIVADAKHRLAFLIDNHRAQVTTPHTWPVALGYAPWVEEVWVNYLSNGVKYGGGAQAPRLELGFDEYWIQTENPSSPHLSSKTRMFRFWIQDYGPGIAPEDQALLFAPIDQTQIRAQGHGLGLSIVRRIVERLGGQVGVESSGVAGEGCLFWFSLPAA